MSSIENETFTQSGYDLLREEVLGGILGDHAPDILYWAGKSLARSHPLASIEETADFFHRVNFGELVLEREKRDETVFVLTPPKTEGRCFKLEAGFLAQQKQHVSGALTEAYEEVLPKKGLVRITLKTDLREKV